MPENTLLSICIPAYNRPLWFRRALSSIVAGNEKYAASIEIIITDDSDNRECEKIAQEVLKEWAGDYFVDFNYDSNYIYEHHSVRLGMQENWNRSICLATGRYVLVLHDDDFLLSGAIAKLLKYIETETYAALLFGVEVVDQSERVMKRQVFPTNQFLSPREALIKLLSNSSFVRFPAIVIARSVFSEVGMFRSEWREPCDLDMWIRIFARYGLYCVQDVTVAYRVHDHALTMGTFNQETVNLLLGLFVKAEQLNILNKADIESCKSLFLHQFILSGAWRQLRRGRLQNFRRVMDLLEMRSLRHIVCPQKWWLVQFSFRVLARMTF